MLSWQRLINSEFGGLEPKTKTSLHLKMMNRLSIVWFHFHSESHSSAEEGARMRSIVIKRLLLFPFISMLLCTAYKGKNAFCKSSCWVLHNRNIYGFINDMLIWCTSFRPNCHRHHNEMSFQNNYLRDKKELAAARVRKFRRLIYTLQGDFIVPSKPETKDRNLSLRLEFKRNPKLLKLFIQVITPHS